MTPEQLITLKTLQRDLVAAEASAKHLRSAIEALKQAWGESFTGHELLGVIDGEGDFWHYIPPIYGHGSGSFYMVGREDGLYDVERWARSRDYIAQTYSGIEREVWSD